jgi:hypothetical protein
MFSLNKPTTDCASCKDWKLTLDGNVIWEYTHHSIDDRKSHLLHAIGRLIAESVDSEVSIDGTHSFSRKGGFGSLESALSTILSCGGCIEYSVNSNDCKPCVTQKDGQMIICVVGNLFDNDRSVFANPVNKAESHHIISRQSLCTGLGYNLVVSGVDTPIEILAPIVVDWRWVTRSKDFSIRVGQVSGHRCGHGILLIQLYKAGILWRQEDIETDVRSLDGKRICVDVICSCPCTDVDNHPATDWIPQFPDTVDAKGAQEISGLLCPPWAETMSKSEIIKALARAAFPWRMALRALWGVHIENPGDGKESVELLNHLVGGSVCEEFLSLLDGSAILVSHTTEAEHATLIEQTGMAMLTRMGMGDTYRMGVLPLSCLEYDRLYKTGAMQGSDCICSTYGTIVDLAKCVFEGAESGCTRKTMCVPYDATAKQVLITVASLIDVPPPIALHTVSKKQIASTMAFEFGTPIFDAIENKHDRLGAGSRAHSTDGENIVHPYRIRLMEGKVMLTRDMSTNERKACDAVPIDGVDPTTVSTSTERTRRSMLKNAFPSMAQRLELKNSTISASLEEAQCRRFSPVWSLEGLDAGENLSSMGMSLMVAFALGGWNGACVRVFVSAEGCAFFAYWNDHVKEFVLVDPISSEKNAFDMAPSLMQCPQSGTTVSVSKGTILEIKELTRWHVCQVSQVKGCEVGGRRALVQYIASRKEEWISLESNLWRRLSINEEKSDIEKVIKSLIKTRDSLGTKADTDLVEQNVKRHRADSAM